MTIEEHDFTLTQLSDSSPFFDLELLHTTKSGKSEMQTAAYGVTIESAIKRIANYRINENSSDSLTMQEYLNQYRIELDKLTKYLNNDL